MPSPVHFSGLASGFDTDSLINALVSAARQPIRLLEGKRSTYNSQLSKYGDLSSKVSSLRTAATTLDSASEFRALSATSSDETIARAVGSSQAMPGSYNFTVSNLAQAERTYSTTFGDKSATSLVGTGTLSIKVGSDDTIDVAIDGSTDTLEDVASKINSSDAAVNASIVYDGSQYRLLVVGERSGDANGITFTESGTTLGLQGATEAQEAVDAAIVMDGITFKSDTNQFTEMIPGVTIDLFDETDAGETVTIKVDVDAEAIEGNVKKVIEEYNTIAKALNAEFQYSGDAKNRGLSGDSAARGIKSRLQTIIAGQVSAISGSTEYTALSRVGISTERDGSLKLDSAAFRDALAKDPDGVTSLFSYNDDDDDTDNDGIAVRLVRAVDQMLEDPGGVIASREDGLNSRIKHTDSRIDALERNLESYETQLRRQFAAMENLMSQFQSVGNFLSAR